MPKHAWLFNISGIIPCGRPFETMKCLPKYTCQGKGNREKSLIPHLHVIHVP